MSIVTLLTDFGTEDNYVAEMKGTVLRVAPSACLVDISHNVRPGDIRSAQYLLDRTWRTFPPATVHLAVVDPGVGTVRRAIAAVRDDQFFVAPDNGLLNSVLEGARVVALDVPRTAAPTFHGRDVFAPAAARLAAGTLFEAIGAPVADPARLPLPVPTLQADQLRGEVIYIDRFGNLITNIPGDRCRAGDVLLETCDVGSVRRTYGDVARGQLVAYVGSGGMLEIAVREGSAADVLSIGVGAAVRVAIRGL